MKRIIRLTESDLIKIVKRVISEQIKQGTGTDPYQYKKDGEKYFFAKKGSENWTQQTKLKGVNGIRKSIFGEPEITQDQLNKILKSTPSSDNKKQNLQVGANVGNRAVKPNQVDTNMSNVSNKNNEISVGMTGEGTYSDTAEGKKYSVVKINKLPCDLVEVTFKNIKSSRIEIAYYKPSEQRSGSKLISFRRSGEGVKSENPCGEFESFGDFGRLQF